jgi:hypothetical protein
MAGILSDAPVGILDPRSAMLTQMGLGLLQAGGPSRTPVSFGQSFGQAGAQGLQAFQQANAAQQEEAMRQLKMKQVQEEMRLAQQKAMQPPTPLSGSPGTQFLDPKTGQVIHTVPFKPDEPKAPAAPTIRVFREGDHDVTKQWDGKEWKELSRGQAFAPKGAASAPSLPKPAPGYRWNADGTAQELIPGGPKDTSKKDNARLETAKTKAQIVIDHVDKAMNQTGFFTTGFIGSVLGNIPGTPAYDLRKTATTIKANIGFQELQAMREASPTGGALGQVAVQELEALQSVLASIDPDQSDEQLTENLTKVKTHYLNWKKAVEQSAAQGGAGGAPGNFPQPPADAVRRLKMNPKEAPLFDEMFGEGAAARVLGR